MKSLRPILNAALGLLLLVQGLVVAAAEYGSFTDATPATTEMSMPCHGQVTDEAGATCPCCDSNCPDMATCAFAPVALLATPGLTLVAADHSLRPRPFSATASFTPQSRLRPPIAFHG
ncbi:MAG: hypothetical protein ACREU7_04200 [Burkholderiales bacterium]